MKQRKSVVYTQNSDQKLKGVSSAFNSPRKQKQIEKIERVHIDLNVSRSKNKQKKTPLKNQNDNEILSVSIEIIDKKKDQSQSKFDIQTQKLEESKNVTPEVIKFEIEEDRLEQIKEFQEKQEDQLSHDQVIEKNEKQNCHSFVDEQEIQLQIKPQLDVIPPEDEYSDYDLYRSEYVKQHPKTDKNEDITIMQNAAIDNLKNKEKTKKSLSQQRNHTVQNKSASLTASSKYFDEILDIFQMNSMEKSILITESQLEKDLQQTQQSLINHLKKHALLSKGDIAPMLLLQKLMNDSFQFMKNQIIPKSKNFFAMALKHFFKNLSDDNLELMCHYYIHNWINEEMQQSNRQFNKYQIEKKLNYINSKKSQSQIKRNQSNCQTFQNKHKKQQQISRPLTRQVETQRKKSLPRFMNPTIGKVQKHFEQYEYEVIKPEILVKRDITPQKTNTQQLAGNFNQTRQSLSKTEDQKTQKWVPTSLRDDSLEKSFQKSIERDSPLKKQNVQALKFDTALNIYQKKFQNYSSVQQHQKKQKSNLGNNTSRVVDRLYSDAMKKISIIEEQKEKLKIDFELRDCTFIPNINKNIEFKIENSSHQNKDYCDFETGKIETERIKLLKNSNSGLSLSNYNTNLTEQNGKFSQRQFLRKDHENQNSSYRESFLNQKLIQQNENESDFSKRKQSSQNDFFDYLAYNGIKSKKVADYQVMKEQNDLKGCTFQPQIIHSKQNEYKRTYNNNYNVYENLMQQQKDYLALEKAKIEQELKKCSFVPQIDKKSEKLAVKMREQSFNKDDKKTHDILYSKYQQQQQKAQKLIKDKELNDMKECTFIPKLISKNRFMKNKASPRILNSRLNNEDIYNDEEDENLKEKSIETQKRILLAEQLQIKQKANQDETKKSKMERQRSSQQLIRKYKPKENLISQVVRGSNYQNSNMQSSRQLTRSKNNLKQNINIIDKNNQNVQSQYITVEEIENRSQVNDHFKPSFQKAYL